MGSDKSDQPTRDERFHDCLRTLRAISGTVQHAPIARSGEPAEVLCELAGWALFEVARAGWFQEGPNLRSAIGKQLWKRLESCPPLQLGNVPRVDGGVSATMFLAVLAPFLRIDPEKVASESQLKLGTPRGRTAARSVVPALWKVLDPSVGMRLRSRFDPNSSDAIKAGLIGEYVWETVVHDTKAWLTVTEAARLSGISAGQISRACSRGTILSNGQEGRSRRVDAAAYIAHLKDREATATRASIPKGPDQPDKAARFICSNCEEEFPARPDFCSKCRRTKFHEGRRQV